MEAVVVAGEIEIPTGLPAIELLGFSEEGEVLVVGKNFNRMWASVKVMSPLVQGSNNTQKFAVVDLVVALCSIKGLRDV